MAREGQGDPCFRHVMMIMMMMYTYSNFYGLDVSVIDSFYDRVQTLKLNA